jgi:hypothetical protein
MKKLIKTITKEQTIYIVGNHLTSRPEDFGIHDSGNAGLIGLDTVNVGLDTVSERDWLNVDNVCHILNERQFEKVKSELKELPFKDIKCKKLENYKGNIYVDVEDYDDESILSEDWDPVSEYIYDKINEDEDEVDDILILFETEHNEDFDEEFKSITEEELNPKVSKTHLEQLKTNLQLYKNGELDFEQVTVFLDNLCNELEIKKTN